MVTLVGDHFFMRKSKYLLIYILISATIIAQTIDLNKLSLEQKTDIYYILKALDHKAQNKYILISEGNSEPTKFNIKELSLRLSSAINSPSNPEDGRGIDYFQRLGETYKNSKLKMKKIKGFRFNIYSSKLDKISISFECNELYLGKSSIGPFMYPSNKLLINAPLIKIH